MLELYECICFLPLNVLRNYASAYACMFGIPAMYHVKFLISALIYPYLCSWGCLPGYCGVHRVLFAGRRVKDMTEWYQSSCCNMGLNGPPRCSDRSRIAFCPAEIRIWWQQNFKKLSECWTVGRPSEKLLRYVERCSRKAIRRGAAVENNFGKICVSVWAIGNI